MADYLTPGAGSPAPGPSLTDPALTGATDQHLAALRDLVQLVRDHRDAHTCSLSSPCPGEWAWDQIQAHGRRRLAGFLALAVAELAALGYGQPTSADLYEVTDAGHQALDLSGGGQHG